MADNNNNNNNNDPFGQGAGEGRDPLQRDFQLNVNLEEMTEAERFRYERLREQHQAEMEAQRMRDDTVHMLLQQVEQMRVALNGQTRDQVGGRTENDPEKERQEAFNKSRMLADMKNFGTSFTGKESNVGHAVRNYLQRLEQRFTDRFVRMEHRAVLAADGMSGVALEWWTMLEPEYREALKSDWDQYKKDVANHFTPKEYGLKADDAFYKLRALTGETIDAYIARFQGAYRALESSPPQKIAASIFMQGLKPAWLTGIKVAGANKLTSTLEELVDMLRVHDGNHRSGRADFHDNDRMDVDRVEAYDDYDGYDSDSDPEDATLMRTQANDRGERNGGWNRFKGNGDRRWGQGNRDQQDDRPRASTECYRCGKKGHVQRKCKAPEDEVTAYKAAYWSARLKKKESQGKE